MLRGGAVVARQAHNLKAGGSIPSPATKKNMPTARSALFFNEAARFPFAVLQRKIPSLKCREAFLLIFPVSRLAVKPLPSVACKDVPHSSACEAAASGGRIRQIFTFRMSPNALRFRPAHPPGRHSFSRKAEYLGEGTGGSRRDMPKSYLSVPFRFIPCFPIPPSSRGKERRENRLCKSFRRDATKIATFSEVALTKEEDGATFFSETIKSI